MLIQPERRRSFRIVTLKNAGWAALSIIVLLIVTSAFTRFAARKNQEHRLTYDDRILARTPEKRLPPPEPVSEGVSGRQVDATRLERYLTVDRTEPLPAPPPPPSPAPPTAEPIRLGGNDGGRVVISDSSGRVRVHVEPAPRRPRS